MAPEDLQSFLRILINQGDLRQVPAEVDPVLEIAAIADRVVKRPQSPALLFDRVKGHPFPVATNLFGSAARMAMALGWPTLDAAAGHLAAALANGGADSPGTRLRRLTELPQHRPRVREGSPCQEVTEEPDLRLLPALQSWPGDGGRYLTLPLIFTRHPETGHSNCGMYRMQIFDSRRGGLHWRQGSGAAGHHLAWTAKGRRMPVAIALGGPPVLTWAASAPLPEEIDEMALAGLLTRKPMEMAPCLSSDLLVPGQAEFVLEGYVEPGETALEGPFGNHTGYYVSASAQPVFHLEAFTRRRRPVYPCTVVGPPPRENYWLAKASERLLLPFLRLGVPEVADLLFLSEGIFHGAALVAVSDTGDGPDLLRRLRQQPLLKGSRLLVLLDADENLQNGSLVLWRMLNQADFGRDLLLENGRLGVDARRRQLGRLGQVGAEAATRALVERRWRDYELD